MIIDNSIKKDPFQDLSLWVLLFSNLITIFFAIRENWNLYTLMWIYLYQSIIIGLVNFIRILELKEFSTEGVKMSGQPIEPSKEAKIFLAFFFLLHYGGFHFGYAQFLSFIHPLNSGELRNVILLSLFFLFNHFFSYFYNRSRDTKKLNIGHLMAYPYARIIPMHTIIIFALFLPKTISLTFFLILKTLADCIMHIVEHTVLR